MPAPGEPRLEGTFRVAPGRRISFAEYGDPNGKLVMWFHGTPGGRRQISPHAHEIANDLGVRVLTLDRPGVGFSTPHLYDNLLGWTEDVQTIVDALGAQRFACVGLSGGGPYVLACAYRFPDRMVAGAVLGGVAPSCGPEGIAGGWVGFARKFAPLLAVGRRPFGEFLYRVIRVLAPVKSQVYDLYMRVSPEGDQKVFRRPEMKQMFLDDTFRSMRKQAHAFPADVMLLTREWGFSLRDIRVPIRFWQGDADNIVPVDHVHHMMRLVGDAELRMRPGESHLAALDLCEEIFKAILECWPSD